MNLFKKIFSKEKPEQNPYKPYIPVPTQQIPGLEPIVVQAIENFFPSIEDQQRAFQYSLKYNESKQADTRILLALLAYTKGYDNKGHIEVLVDLDSGPLGNFHFMMEQIEPIFPDMKAAEEWVKSITNPQV